MVRLSIVVPHATFEKEGATGKEVLYVVPLMCKCDFGNRFGKLPLRIRATEWAIRQRLSSSLPIDGAEQELITGARARLMSLKTERLAKTA
jgi:hypothetical protein